MLIEKFEKFIVAILLAFFLGISIFLAITDSQTIDEGPHISAGYSYWQTGDFRINPEHPPLVKLLSSAPFLIYKPSLPLNHESWQNYNEWEFGRQFLYYNEKPADTIILLARLPIILLALILGLYIYKWSKELFGIKAGIVALFFFALSPNFIAHSHLVTTDVALSLFFLLSIYYFGKYLKAPNIKNLIIAGIIFSLAILTKYSALILVPLLLILYLIYWLKTKKQKILNFKKLLVAFFVFLGITFLATFIFYGFEFKKPMDDPRVSRLYEERIEIIESGKESSQPLFVKPLLTLGNPDTSVGNFIKNFADNFPVPAYSYWRGFFSVLSHNFWGHGTYLMGMHGEQGWWYYFIIAFLVKTPLPTIILFGFIILYLCHKFVRKKIILHKTPFFKSLKGIQMNYYLLTVPPLIYFLWSLTSHINLGVRHILPIYPFVFIILSSLVCFKFKKNILHKIFKYVFIILLIFYLFTSFKIFPYYLSYFNEAIGGSSRGTEYLLDSNIDWSQDFKRLKKYVEENNIEEYYACNFGSLVTDYYVKHEKGMPFTEEIEKNGIQKGYYIISVGALYDRSDIFSWLREYEPYEKIGYSIYVYKF